MKYNLLIRCFHHFQPYVCSSVPVKSAVLEEDLRLIKLYLYLHKIVQMLSYNYHSCIQTIF